MKKRKVLLLALAVSMVAILAVGGTLAYFTDTDTAKNTFTVGKIKIALNENNGRDGDDYAENEAYQDWLETSDAELLPDLEQPKYVSVKNVGSRGAYIWVELWIPASLDDSTTQNHAGASLHMISDDSYVVETKVGYLGQKEINGVWYNGYIHFNGADGWSWIGHEDPYNTTGNLLMAVKMDVDVIQCTDHADCHILKSGEHYANKPWEIIVNAIGIQADTLYDEAKTDRENIYNAIDTYYNNGRDVADYLW